MANRHAALFTNIGGEYNIPKATAAKSVRDFDEVWDMCDGGHWQSARPYTDHESPLDVREDAKALVTVFGLFIA